MPQGPPRRRRARPVADAPIDALLLRAEDLAKGWLLALLEQAPLDDAPAILAADLARDGPRACEAVVRALADDGDLRRLEPGGALERLVAQVGAFAGAGSVDAVVRAVDALSAVLWSAIRSELVYPDVDQVTELAERHALVMEHVRAAALRAWTGMVARERPRPVAESAGPRPVAEPAGPRPVAESAGPRPVAESAGPRPVVQVFDDPQRPARPEEQPTALWMGALADEIRHSDRTGSPLSLLVVELEEAERMDAVEGASGARATFGRFAQALRSVMRRQDILACESETRAWVIARETSRMGAQALGERIAGAVRAEAPWRGAPLAVSVGVAVFGEDGQEVSSLVDAAEESRFAAAASGVAVMRADEPVEGQLDNGLHS
jgi:GGDEF domain-containing protein